MINHLVEKLFKLPYKNYQLQVGDGEIACKYEQELIPLPNEIVLENDTTKLLNSEDCENYLIDHIFWTDVLNIALKSNTAILCPKNEDVSSVNENVLKRLHAEGRSCFSSDIECEDESEANTYPEEFVHQITPNSLPPHELNLKLNSIIILFKNPNTSVGLCNGTRLIVKCLSPNIIDTVIKDGSYKGDRFLLPRMDFESTDDLPFHQTLKEFPVRSAFAVTINKSQGQTFVEIGLYIREPVLSHGQLYVALSRVRNGSSIKCFVRNYNHQGIFSNDPCTYTKNVVYKS